MKNFVFWLKFHWTLSLRVLLAILQHWFSLVPFQHQAIIWINANPIHWCGTGGDEFKTEGLQLCDNQDIIGNDPVKDRHTRGDQVKGQSGPIFCLLTMLRKWITHRDTLDLCLLKYFCLNRWILHLMTWHMKLSTMSMMISWPHTYLQQVTLSEHMPFLCHQSHHQLLTPATAIYPISYLQVSNFFGSKCIRWPLILPIFFRVASLALIAPVPVKHFWRNMCEKSHGSTATVYQTKNVHIW